MSRSQFFPKSEDDKVRRAKREERRQKRSENDGLLRQRAEDRKAIQEMLVELKEFTVSLRAHRTEIDENASLEELEAWKPDSIFEVYDNLEALAKAVDEIADQILEASDDPKTTSENRKIIETLLTALKDPNDSNINNFCAAAEPTRLAVKAAETARLMVLARKALLTAIIMAISAPIAALVAGPAGAVAAPVITGILVAAVEKYMDDAGVAKLDKKSDKSEQRRDWFYKQHENLEITRNKIRSDEFADFHDDQRRDDHRTGPVK